MATSNSTVQGIVYQIIMTCSQYYCYDCLIHPSQGAQVHVLKEMVLNLGKLTLGSTVDHSAT